MSNAQTVKTLQRLYKICKAGERGFRTVAENIQNRGLKVLLKTYAQQRRELAAELQTQIERYGGSVKDLQSVRGVIHRGRITLVSTLTISQEHAEATVLKEAERGERVALKTYEKALRTNLPPEVHAMVERQYNTVKATGERVHRLSGRPGDRLIIRLYDNEADLQSAIQALEQADFNAENMEVVALDQTADMYNGESSTIFEVVASGAFGGAIWGSILGAVIGAGSLMAGFTSLGISVWGLVALGGIAAGAIFGAILGFLIGVGIREEDDYLYDNSFTHGSKMVILQTNRKRASDASRIMQGVNIASRGHRLAKPQPAM